MALQRTTLDRLHAWRHWEDRKPLVLRGTRQVGKTTLVREFGKSYARFVELNLDRSADREVFDLDELSQVLNMIQLRTGITLMDDGQSLLFIDEVQAEPKAVQMLRYFHEERPGLHVIAAGSLLEFALKDVASIPVGRVHFQYLHPLNFPEFLLAVDNLPALEALGHIPLQPHTHSTLLRLFHEYALIGGMPEVVAAYVVKRDVAPLQRIHGDLWDTYLADVEKYARNSTERQVIAHVIATAPLFLERIKYEGFGGGGHRSREVGEAFRALDRAGLVRIVHPSTSMSPPIVPDLRKRPRLQFLDTGLLNQVLGAQAGMVGIDDLSQIHRGRIVQHLVVQELVSLQERSAAPPCFWVREGPSANAEVDILHAQDGRVIPVEVKAGAQGRLRSLHQFMDSAPHPYAVRCYAGPLVVERHRTPAGTPFLLLNLPYFLATRMREYVEWFVREHTLDE
jgi:predicted AAA+ superfamily ATPase